jgi:hypothetical protein
MSHAARKIAADTLGHGQFNARWMVEITYNNDRPGRGATRRKILSRGQVPS